MNHHQVIITKVFLAPIEKVFKAFVDPLQMMQWYSPENMTTPHAEADPQVGGAYVVTMMYNETPSRREIVRGVYKEIQKPTKLRFSWQWDGQEDVTEVTVLLRAISDEQTELTLIHSGFEDKEYQKGFSPAEHNGGWNSAFNRLEVLMGKGE